MGTVKVTNIEPIADNGTLTIGNSGDTIALTSGAKTSGFGKVGQVVETVRASNEVTSNSSSKIDTGLSATITPTSTSSKILILLTHGGIRKGATNSDVGVYLNRGSTEIATINGFMLFTNTTDQLYGTTVNYNYLDSPSTTSETTYKTTFNRPDGTGNVFIGGSGADSTMTLLEILD